MFKRPSPAIVRAKQLEIKRRYEQHAKVSKRSRGMAAIRISELTRWMHDTFGGGVELEPDKRTETIIRIFAHHFISLPSGERRLSSWFDRYCPWLELRDREYLISEANHCPLKWSADKLGWKIGLTDEQRARLKIKTIGAVGISKEQRKERERQRRAQRQKERRAAKRAARVPYI